MDKNNKRVRETYYEYYRVKRTVEYMEQYDHGKSWRELKDKIGRRHTRKMTRALSIAATVFVFVASVVYFHVTVVFKKPELPVVMAGDEE